MEINIARSMACIRTLLSISIAVFLVALPAVGFGQPKDPFAPSASTGSAQPDPTAAAPTAPASEAMSAACEHITADVCDGTNKSLIAISLGYLLASVALFTILRMWMERRGKATMTSRVVITCVLAGAITGVLAGLDPFRGQDIKCCLASGTLKMHVMFQDSSIGRAFVLGAIPAAIVFLVIWGIQRLARR